jgi:hypothetical protein
MINISTGKFVCFSFAFFTYIEFCCWMGRKLGLLVKSSRILSIEQTALLKIENSSNSYLNSDLDQTNQLLLNQLKQLLTVENNRRQIRLNIRFNNIEKEQAEIRARIAKISAEHAEIRVGFAEIREQQAENKKNRKKNKKSFKIIQQRTDELGLKLADLKMDTERFISDLRERKSLREREN